MASPGSCALRILSILINTASLRGERAVGVAAYRSLLRRDGCGWKPSRAMPTQARMNRREARISRPKSGECQLFMLREQRS